MTHRTRPARSRHAVLAAICFSALILPLSFSGGAIATPAIGRDLGGDPILLTWITNAFMLTFGSMLLLAGGLADKLGRKRLFLSGIALFAVSSAAAAMLSGVLMIDCLRALQGAGAAAALASGNAALAQEYDGPARLRAFSVLGTTFGVGLAFGPLVCAAMIAQFGWRAVFVLTLAVSLLAFGVASVAMRETKAPHSGPLDIAGGASFSGALALFTFAIIEAPRFGWGSATTLALIAGSAALLLTFVRIERGAAHPLLRLDLFRDRRFLGVQALPVATCYSYVVLLVLLPLGLVGIEGMDEIAAGLAMLALSAPMLVVPSIAARLSHRWPAGTISAAGLILAAGGLWWLGRAAPGSGLSPIAPLLLIGSGSALPWGLMDGLSVSVVPVEQAGMASGIFSTVRVAGEGIALATVAAMLNLLVSARLPERAPGPANEAAQWLSAGDLDKAAHLLPDTARAALKGCYSAAFADLTHILACVVVAAALVTFALLRHGDDVR